MEGKKRKGNQSSDGRGEKEKKKTLEGSSPEREQGGECEFCVVRTEISAGLVARWSALRGAWTIPSLPYLTYLCEW